MPRYILETADALSAADISAIRSVRLDASVTPQSRTLHIIGRRWFQRTYGNTYHTAEVIIDGVRVFKSSPAYGYGDQYLTTAHEWLIATGHLPQREERNGSRGLGHTLYLREESGFAFSYECHDVARQKDL